MDETTLTIGQLAARFGLNTSAIRYYEANSVLPAPIRISGRRRYGTDEIRRLEILVAAKRAGLSLDEIRLLLQRADSGSPAFDSIREVAARKLPEVEELIAQAHATRQWLLHAATCTCESFDVCELFAG
jgi:DNA-binding transcriptional MerR regulator